ncbi:MAG: (2Fe-2S)-binding protein [Acidobacteria bacterium]|nr:(2Fe-2S)-binding protein [Acidobacteriota bacterium]
MPRMVFESENRILEVEAGISILEAAEKFGIPLEHACGGICACTTCRVDVVEGAENLTPVQPTEENLLREVNLTGPFRLGCQARVAGNVKLRIPRA